MSDTDDIRSMSQQEVKEYYRSKGAEAASVGDYVRIEPVARTKTGFGPIEEDETTWWTVVEIDWQEKQFLIAPLEHRL